jgi:hypothetical protein
MIGVDNDVNSKLLNFQNMKIAFKRSGENSIFDVAEEIRELLPFSLNQVIINNRSNALSKQAVEDRIIQPILLINHNVNIDEIRNHTLIKVCSTFFERI